jgi:hypothetical protein
MSAPETPKKRHWQIRLSSLLAATICTGTMLGVNLRERELIKPYGGAAPYVTDERGVARVSGFGWPCVCKVRLEYDESRRLEFNRAFKPTDASASVDGSQQWPDGSSTMRLSRGRYFEEFQYGVIPVAVDALIGISACFALVALMERFIRRREGRKP